MSEVERIRDQIRRAWQGEAWHGPSLQDLLEGVDAKAAGARPVPRAHSIGEIVLHIAAWADIVRRRTSGEKFEVTAELDWPPYAGGKKAWNGAVKSVKRAHIELEKSLAGRSDESLERRVNPQGSTDYVQLHGAVQHSLYHGGQIAILKKALLG